MSLGSLKRAVFVACVLPALWLVGRGFTNDLGANPIEEVTHQTGIWTFRFLLATLAITPLRYLTAWSRLVPLRRMVGLFTFFYACLHFLTYGVDYWLFDLDAILDDVINRPYITAGFTGFILLIPLAVTSTHAMVRRLGGRRWQQLHRLVYFSAGAGAAHFLWQTKIDLRRPGIYVGCLALLLGIRLWERFGSRWLSKVTR